MPQALIETSRLTVVTPSGRILFKDLSLSLEPEKVALVGRNGVGKSTLLEVLAGLQKPHSGQVVSRTVPHLVSQLQHPQNESHGQLRQRRLRQALNQAPQLLLLDEPTQDLDWQGIVWLRDCLNNWKGGALVASHDTNLLRDFEHFFVLSKSGCRYFRGPLAELEIQLEQEEARRQAQYLSSLQRMVEHEEHSQTVARRRARKERYGRVREIDRGSPRVVLNLKRNQAQVTHGKQRVERQARLEALRQLAKAGRRALQVKLPLVLPAPEWGPSSPNDIVRVSGKLTFRLRHQRMAVTGPNGAGKTNLLDTLTGRRTPLQGSVWSDPARLGSIAQGAADWMLDQSLLSLLEGPEPLLAHKFPLALAVRPLRSLSPGERVRAALICLFQRAPGVELLILDEPTCGLDLLGKRALSEALKAWPGGLVVASHDFDFLNEIRIEQWLTLE